MPNVPPLNANEHIEQKLDECIGELELTLDADVLTFVGDILGGVDDEIRDIIEEKRRQTPKRSNNEARHHFRVGNSRGFR